MDDTATPPVPGVDATTAAAVAPAPAVGTEAVTQPAAPVTEAPAAEPVGFESKSISEQLADLNARVTALETSVVHPQAPEGSTLADKVHVLYRTIFGSED